MGDVGDDFKGMRDELARQRQLSLEKAIASIPEAQAAAQEAGFHIEVKNNGHHWQFSKSGSLILNFWPASAKAMRLAGKPFRCRGWRHALAKAELIASHVQGRSGGWTT